MRDRDDDESRTPTETPNPRYRRIFEELEIVRHRLRRVEAMMRAVQSRAVFAERLHAVSFVSAVVSVIVAVALLLILLHRTVR